MEEERRQKKKKISKEQEVEKHTCCCSRVISCDSRLLMRGYVAWASKKKESEW